MPFLPKILHKQRITLSFLLKNLFFVYAININDIKNELAYEYEQILTQINTYDEYEKTVENNLKLYDDLIMVNQSSNAAGMTSDYDLEVLQNTKKINEYDLEINDINKKLQYSKLYFKTKADI